MPAHIGIFDRLKLPFTLIKLNLSHGETERGARAMSHGWIGPRDIAEKLDNAKHGRELECLNYAHFRTRLDKYSPKKRFVGFDAVDKPEWDLNLAPGKLVDAAVHASFATHKAVKVTLIRQKGKHNGLKRIEAEAQGIANHIIWSAA